MSVTEMIDKAVEISKATVKLRDESNEIGYCISVNEDNVILSGCLDAIAGVLGVKVLESKLTGKSEFGFTKCKHFKYKGVEFLTYE